MKKKKKIKSFPIFSTKQNKTISHYQVNSKIFLPIVIRSQTSLKRRLKVSKSFLEIFDYFVLFLIKNIETNLPIKKNIQKNLNK